jgi:hypothetical protein
MEADIQDDPARTAGPGELASDEPAAFCNETYLGDAVYASFDGYQIWLRTGDGNDQRIALDPDVYSALTRYVQALKRGAQSGAAATESESQGEGI